MRALPRSRRSSAWFSDCELELSHLETRALWRARQACRAWYRFAQQAGHGQMRDFLEIAQSAFGSLLEPRGFRVTEHRERGRECYVVYRNERLQIVVQREHGGESWIQITPLDAEGRERGSMSKDLRRLVEESKLSTAPGDSAEPLGLFYAELAQRLSALDEAAAEEADPVP